MADHPSRPRRCTLTLPLDARRITRDFAEAVNLSATELRSWLATGESRRVGWKGADGSRTESVGHASGRWIAEILEKSAAELTAEDYAQMCKTIGFIRRHLAQEPANPVTSNWRYSLMNWGHDPLKGKAGDKDGVTAEIAMHRDKAVSAIIAEAKSALEKPA